MAVIVKRINKIGPYSPKLLQNNTGLHFVWDTVHNTKNTNRPVTYMIQDFRMEVTNW